jgi:hypothetical protein
MTVQALSGICVAPAVSLRSREKRVKKEEEKKVVADQSG